MNRVLLFFTFSAACAGFWACQGDTPPVSSDSQGMTRETPSPTYTDVEPRQPRASAGNFENLIADFESNDRVIWQKPGMVISLLGDLEGKTVADIGAGSGYFTFRLVPRAKKVIGVDIDPRFINFMDSVKVRLPEQFRDRFESRLAKPDDPMLKPNEADAVIMVNTYGYIENRVKYLQTLSAGMSVGGVLLIIDFKKNSLPVGPDDEYKIALSQVERELKAGGFEISKTDNEALDYQYIVLAAKPKSSSQ